MKKILKILVGLVMLCALILLGAEMKGDISLWQFIAFKAVLLLIFFVGVKYINKTSPEEEEEV